MDDNACQIISFSGPSQMQKKHHDARSFLPVETLEKERVKLPSVSDSRTISPIVNANCNDSSSEWSNLPEEIAMSILAFLTWRGLSRVRCVCRKWDRMIHFSEYLHMCAKASPQEPFCIMKDFWSNEFASYNPTFNSWHHLPKSFFSFICASTDFSLVGGAGCLLLLRVDNSEFENSRRKLHVVNPTTKCSRQFPENECGSARRIRNSFTGMVMDRETDTYKILIVDLKQADDGSHFYTFQVYDSESNSWVLQGRLHGDVAGVHICSAAFYKGRIHCLVSDNRGLCHVYRVGQEAWDRLQPDVPFFSENEAHLFGHRGTLMLGGVSTNEICLYDSVHLFRLDEATSRWVLKQVLKFPLFIAQKCEKARRIRFVGDGDYLCANCEEEFGATICGHITNVIMCDIIRNMWWCDKPQNGIEPQWDPFLLLEPWLTTAA